MVVPVHEGTVSLSALYRKEIDYRLITCLNYNNFSSLEIVEAGDDTEVKLYAYVSLVSLIFCPHWNIWQLDSEMLKGDGTGRAPLVCCFSAL